MTDEKGGIGWSPDFRSAKLAKAREVLDEGRFRGRYEVVVGAPALARPTALVELQAERDRALDLAKRLAARLARVHEENRTRAYLFCEDCRVLADAREAGLLP